MRVDFTAFNNRWNISFDRRHPSLWIFVRKLKDEQRLTEIAAAAARTGQAPPKRRLKWRRFEAKLLRLKIQYNTGNRTANQYWNAVAATMRVFH